MRFTLTMWDVKTIYEFYSFFVCRFYLNYVGCKGLIHLRIHNHLFRFTLTMWDVKSKFTFTFECFEECFTLTMWDVK